jgi:hypothetical protein
LIEWRKAASAFGKLISWALLAFRGPSSGFSLRILSLEKGMKILNNDEQILKVFLAIFAGKFNSLEAM